MTSVEPALKMTPREDRPLRSSRPFQKPTSFRKASASKTTWSSPISCISAKR